MSEIFFLLIAAHFLLDLVLQPQAMANGKNRRHGIHLEASNGFPPWPYWMTGHASGHGAAVLLITGQLWLGLVETALHWIIDFTKCEGRINFHTDQALHLVCKFGYCYYLFG